MSECLTPVLDVGCGEGELARHLPSGAWVGVDSSPQMLARAPQPNVLADATSLPFPDGSFASSALLYVLYHLPDPRQALTEAHRVLRPGGLIAVAAPSRDDSPELTCALPRWSLTFDAELAPELLAEHFEDVEVERWDARLMELPTRSAVREYLVGKGSDPATAQAAAEVAHPAVRHQAGRTGVRAQADDSVVAVAESLIVHGRWVSPRDPVVATRLTRLSTRRRHDTLASWAIRS